MTDTVWTYSSNRRTPFTMPDLVIESSRALEKERTKTKLK
jgi:hypothetical protein